MTFYVVGYAFAFGSGNSFIGYSYFGLYFADDGIYPEFFFQFAFVAAAATIVSGAMAERAKFVGYLGYSVLITGLVYPVVAHWIWSAQGWLSAYNPAPLLGVGMIDVAGSAVVHMVGGFAALLGAVAVGPRLGRFDADGRTLPMPGHSAPLVALGTFILWFGWYGFNTGALVAATGDAGAAGRTTVTTTLSASLGGITALVIKYWLSGYVVWDLPCACNGILAGLVSVTGACAVVAPWAAVVSGIAGGAVYMGCSTLLLGRGVDDPVEATAVHGCGGVTGILIVGLFARKDYVAEVYGVPDPSSWGLVYGSNGRLFACQLIGIACVVAWVTVLMGGFFALLRWTGSIRVTEKEEREGVDVSMHGGTAYTATKGTSMSRHMPNGVFMRWGAGSVPTVLPEVRTRGRRAGGRSGGLTGEKKRTWRCRCPPARSASPSPAESRRSGGGRAAAAAAGAAATTASGATRPPTAATRRTGASPPSRAPSRRRCSPRRTSA